VDVNGTMVVGTLKTNKNRAVVLPPFVKDALAQTAEGKDRDELLWPSRTGGYLGPPSSSDSWLAGAVRRCQKQDKAFPRVTAHDLRHTAASLAISAGANPKVVQRMLGQRGDDAGRIRRSFQESDLDEVAVTVAKMWPHEPETNARSAPKTL
jgi:integrase